MSWKLKKLKEAEERRKQFQEETKEQIEQNHELQTSLGKLSRLDQALEYEKQIDQVKYEGEKLKQHRKLVEQKAKLEAAWEALSHQPETMARNRQLEEQRAEIEKIKHDIELQKLKEELGSFDAQKLEAEEAKEKNAETEDLRKQLEKLQLQQQIEEQKAALAERESQRQNAESRRDGTDTTLFQERYDAFYGKGRVLKVADCLDDAGYKDYLQWIDGRYHSIGGQQLATIRKQYPDIERAYKEHKAFEKRDLTALHSAQVYAVPDPLVICVAFERAKSGNRLIWMCNKEGGSIECFKYANLSTKEKIAGDRVFRETNEAVTDPQTFYDSGETNGVNFYGFSYNDNDFYLTLYCSQLVQDALSEESKNPLASLFDAFKRSKRLEEDQANLRDRIQEFADSDSDREYTDEELDELYESMLDEAERFANDAGLKM